MESRNRRRAKLVRICLIAVIVSLEWSRDSIHAKDLITGAGDGGSQHVKRFDGETLTTTPSGEASTATASFLAYGGVGLPNGVRVAAGDVTGDGTADIITGLGDGAGAAAHVKVFDGQTLSEVQSFFAYSPSFAGGVFVASGDLNGDPFDDIVTGAGAGGNSHVKVFSGSNNLEIRSFLAYGGTAAEVRVGAGDINNDGRDDIITALGSGAAPHVKVFDGVTNDEIRSFFAYGAFAGGVYVASGDIDGDGFSDIITGAGAGGDTHVKVFSGNNGAELRSFFAYGGSSAEVRVGAGDVNGDGRDDIITGLGPGASPHVKAFSGLDNSELLSFFAYSPSFSGGVYVAGVTVPEPTPLLLAALSLIAFTGRRTRRRCVK